MAAHTLHPDEARSHGRALRMLDTTLRLTALLITWTVALPAIAGAQPTRMPTVTLLKRLAEAVDGNRGGTPVYVVASYRFPNEVAGVYRNQQSADSAARASGPDHDVFGPYDPTPIDIVRPGTSPVAIAPGGRTHLLLRCVHDGRSSMMHIYMCPPDPLIDRDLVRALGLTVTLTNGRVVTLGLPQSTDAIFLGMEAIDKFAVPYYSRIIGPAATLEMRAAIDSIARRRP